MELGKDKRVFVRLGFTDMRKQINGLAAIVQEQRPEGPFVDSQFNFNQPLHEPMVKNSK